jgi:flotillin
MELIYNASVLIAIILAIIFVIGLTLARLYRRAEKDRAYVRTGLGGQKVILDGGSLLLPVFHSINWVNLQTLRLDVRRENAEAMITKDRMRVDIGVEFYVRVRPDESSIALAAQTLGNRTNDAGELRELVEAKFVDALRSVAATMSLADLQENRSSFVQSVQTAVARDLELNGLELESASLTKLDQTDTKYFNPNNAFDAEGLTALTKITEMKKQERNLTVRAAEVTVAQQDLEARQKILEIERQKQEAALNQQRDIANKTATTRAETAQKEAEARRAEEEAKIAADQAIAQRQAAADQAKQTARITAELGIQQQKIESERTAETLAIGKRQAVEIADQERSIAVANQSRAQSEAKAEAEKARALATSAEETVETARQVAMAERERQTAVIAARREAEREATRLTVAAEAARTAAQNHAEAKRVEAQGEAEAIKLKADAKAADYAVEAAGQAKINEARNMLSPAIIELEITKERLRIIPAALAEAVKPMEKIGDVRIVDLNGWSPNGGGMAQGGGGPMDSLLSALLQYRANAPIIDQLLASAGFTGTNPVDALVKGAVPAAPALNGGHPPAGAAQPAIPVKSEPGTASGQT